jgi:hypothetical protein
MKIAQKILLRLIALIALVAALMIGLQIYYKLTPPALSPEAAQLNARAALLPTVTENGYRFYGLLAPKDVAPVRYGKCLVDAHDAHRAERQTLAATMPAPSDEVAYNAYWKKYGDRSAALAVSCLEGGTRVAMPKEFADLRITPGIAPAQWQALAAVVPDPLIVARAEAVWAGGPRRLGVAPDSPMMMFQDLIQLERWRTARAVLAWQSGDRLQAANAWNRSIADWVKSADDTLIDAMISIASLSQVMIGMQDSFARSERVDDATADAALAALGPIELMPMAVAETMVAEWQTMSEIARSIPVLPSQFRLLGGEQQGAIARGLDGAARLTFDVNDTLNTMALGWRRAELTVLSAAQGKPLPAPTLQPPWPPCAALGDWQYLCTLFLRNPTGRILALIGAPSYTDYGVRVGDLKNLAAATRLTIAARQRAVSGDALASFIATAPTELRDIFTDQPFTYDPATKALKIELRTTSTVLGAKGVYSLKL